VSLEPDDPDVAGRGGRGARTPDLRQRRGWNPAACTGRAERGGGAARPAAGLENPAEEQHVWWQQVSSCPSDENLYAVRGLGIYALLKKSPATAPRPEDANSVSCHCPSPPKRFFQCCRSTAFLMLACTSA
jgi:hypothetical protein